MSLAGFARWLDSMEWSTALHESLFIYAYIEATHVLTLMLFAGTIAMVDLRLLGVAFRTVPISEMTRRILPWTVAGFVIMVITGLLLFYAIPVRTYHSIWFRAKLIFLAIAAINIFLFHFRVQRDMARWDRMALPPAPVRAVAGVSLAAWAGVIVTGRLIAYGWFDCDKPQPAFVSWAAECAAMLPDL